MSLGSFPVVELRSPDVAIYDHVNIASFWRGIDLGLIRGVPFMVLHDARAIPHVDDGRRQHFMRLLEERRRDVERLVVGYAAVVNSPLERGLITAFMWFVKLPLPLRLFTSEAEARAWLWARYDDATERQAAALSAE